jgi:hypothetical protein
VCVVLSVTRVCTHGFILLRQVLYWLSHSSNPYFALVILELRAGFLPRSNWTLNPLRLPDIAGMTGSYYHPQLFLSFFLFFFLLRLGLMDVFAQGWPGATILQILASCITRNRGMSHWCLLIYFSYFWIVWTRMNNHVPRAYPISLVMLLSVLSTVISRCRDYVLMEIGVD